MTDLTNLNLDLSRRCLIDSPEDNTLKEMILLPTAPKCEYSSPCIINDGVCPFNVNACLCKPRKLFKTLIRGKVHWIYSRQVEHQYGKLNGCPDTWWLLIKYDDEYEWTPWIDKAGTRPCWEITVRQDNYIKHKYGGSDIRSTCHVDMKCNGEVVYEFGCNDINYAMSKSQYKMIEMMEHPFNFMNPQEEIGRRIWFKRQAAVISELLLDQGCLILEYKGVGAGFDLIDPWEDDSFPISEENGEKTVKVGVFSDDIYWFRDKGKGETSDNDMVTITTESGSEVVYPKALYNQIRYDVEYDFRKQFGIKRGGGDTIFFDHKMHDSSNRVDKRSLSIPLKTYDKELQNFHKMIVEKHILTNG